MKQLDYIRPADPATVSRLLHLGGYIERAGDGWTLVRLHRRQILLVEQTFQKYGTIDTPEAIKQLSCDADAA